MNKNLDPNVFMIIILILFIAMMWMSSRRMKKQQKQQQEELRQSLVPGTLVSLAGGIIATIVSVDEKYEEAVVESEGSTLRVKLQAIRGKYIRPAFIDDDEEDADADASEEATENEGENPVTDAENVHEADSAESKAGSDGDAHAETESDETPVAKSGETAQKK